MKLDDRELATVLAALRHWQRETTVRDRAEKYSEHFYEVTALDDEEVDDLCERLNCAPAKKTRK